VVDKQMSKSIGGSGCVWLLDEPRLIEKKIRSAVTDTGREVTYDPVNKPGVSNLLTILSAFTGRPLSDLEADFTGRGYGDLKKEVAAAVLDWVMPFQKRVEELLENPAVLDDILADGAARAEAVAGSTLAEAYDAVGLLAGRR
jgi:tryptophanyl-tRNA synthetase